MKIFYNLLYMDLCCFSRKKIKLEDYEDLSTHQLKRKLNKYKSEKCRNCTFSILYGTASLGATVTTLFSTPISAAATVPAASVAAVSCVDCVDKYKNYSEKIDKINKILEERKKEIKKISKKNN